MHFLRLSLLLILLVLFSACEKKKYPESLVTNEPEFYAELNGSGSSTLIEAGINNYMLFSSYTQDQKGLYTYVAELRQKNCPSVCPNSIRFEINDSKTSAAGAAADINSAIYPGSYPYVSSEWVVNFKSRFNKPVSGYFWNFGDGEVSTVANPSHTYKKGGNYTVCLTIKSLNGCESSICNTVAVGFAPDRCMAYVSDSIVSSNTMRFKAQTFGVAPFTFQWDFGDGKGSEEAQPNHSYAVRGAYPVRLSLRDAKNELAVWNYNTITSGDSSSCASNFSPLSMTALNDSVPFSQVVIKYRDAGGVEYSSKIYAQDQNSKFEVLSVSDFEPNERGEATKKLKLRFSAILYNGTKKLKFENAEAVICISYKK
ncbi:MAG: PKD domain-containing protein [Bacteroidia bacterium]|nr:PKD domain-containing protein [Bacteroidia bacterium]